jgi:hypothetical protein
MIRNLERLSNDRDVVQNSPAASPVVSYPEGNSSHSLRIQRRNLHET